MAPVVYAIDRSFSRPSEEPLLEIAEAEEAFGGYYCENGDLIVLVAGQAEPEVERRLVELIADKTVSSCRSRNNPDHEPEVVVRETKYNFLTLRTWRDAAGEPFFASEGARSLGIDYRANRLVMGVEPDSLHHPNDVATVLGIPTDAFTAIEESEPVYLDQGTGCDFSSLEIANCRPVPGGVSMDSTESGGGGQIQGECTIGSANLRWNGSEWQDGWVVAGHCVAPRGSMDSRWLYQPYVGAGGANLIGVEFVDPPFWSCGSQLCRNSDSAWVYAFPESPEHGRIARPENYYGSITIDSARPRFNVVSSRNAIQGMEVDKVGIKGGWTWGVVTSVCVDRSPTLTNIRYVCQDDANSPASGGDSGGPVMFWLWGGNFSVSDVDLVGIHWGHFTSSGTSVYSPWGQVAADLGTIFIAPL